jgi:Tfp pilus assembly protein PilN
LYLYVATSAPGRPEWRTSPWRAARRFARRGLLPLAVAGAVVLLAGLVLLAPSRLVAHDTAAGTLTAEQRAKATSDARTALLQAVGGLLLAAGAAATWRQVRISREGR